MKTETITALFPKGELCLTEESFSDYLMVTGWIEEHQVWRKPHFENVGFANGLAHALKVLAAQEKRSTGEVWADIMLKKQQTIVFNVN